jgi:hypothetical protein
MTQPPTQPYVIMPQPTNTLGIAGFICSLVGLIMTGGLLCPIGLLLSLIALGRQPRGFAIAGVVLGLVGSCGAIIIGLLFITALAGAAAAVGIAAMPIAQQATLSSDMINTAAAIQTYEQQNRYLPAELGVLGLDDATLRDPWGNAYQYHLLEEPPGFDLVSYGPDGLPGGDDEVRFSEIGDTWAPFGVIATGGSDGGKVTIRYSGGLITAVGDDDGGVVTIDLGDRVIEIVGTETGGTIEVTPAEPAESPEAPVPVEAPGASVTPDSAETGAQDAPPPPA